MGPRARQQRCAACVQALAGRAGAPFSDLANQTHIDSIALLLAIVLLPWLPTPSPKMYPPLQTRSSPQGAYRVNYSNPSRKARHQVPDPRLSLLRVQSQHPRSQVRSTNHKPRNRPLWNSQKTMCQSAQSTISGPIMKKLVTALMEWSTESAVAIAQL